MVNEPINPNQTPDEEPFTDQHPGDPQPETYFTPKENDVPAPEKLFHPETDQYELEDDLDRIYDLHEVSDLEEYTPEARQTMEKRMTETMKVFRSGELVEGKIVAISDNSVTIDIGFKSEGSIELEEFDHPDQLAIGQVIEVCIDSIEDSEGTLVLSKRKAEFIRVWERINQYYQTGEIVEAQIVRRIKGGMVVDLFGIEAFLPGSQIDVHPVRDFDALVGNLMDFRIIKVNNARKNVVLSRKVLIEESLRETREKVLADLQEGQVVEGVVKNITDFGVFVDLGGVDGLLHITDLSWGRVSHPSDSVKLDERIKVKVLHYDRERQRISLGLKQLQEHHWDEIESRYPVSAKIKGKVISIVKYGAFVELEPGVEGLVHISEMSWTQHIKHPSQIVGVGNEIDVVVLSVDRENRKISLGMKQVEEDPWQRLEQVYQIQSRHRGVVRDLVPFGAFVELEPGIDGLIHISDLSWTRKVRHPGEIVKKGQEIEVVILNFDKDERRIGLGLKQLEDDPWDRFEREYQIRSQTEGSVIRVLEKGLVVMLPMGVEGFVPNSHLGKAITGENKKKVKEGDNLELEVIEFDKGNHRIVLSHASVERSKERAVYRTLQESGEDSRTTIGDIVSSHAEGEAEATIVDADVIETDREVASPAETEPADGDETIIDEAIKTEVVPATADTGEIAAADVKAETDSGAAEVTEEADAEADAQAGASEEEFKPAPPEEAPPEEAPPEEAPPEEAPPEESEPSSPDKS